MATEEQIDKIEAALKLAIETDAVGTGSYFFCEKPNCIIGIAAHAMGFSDLSRENLWEVFELNMPTTYLLGFGPQFGDILFRNDRRQFRESADRLLALLREFPS